MKDKNKRKIFKALIGLFSLTAVSLFSNVVFAEEKESTIFSEFEVTPSLYWLGVEGDNGRFRQDWRMPDGVSGGIEEFKAVTNDGKISIEGHAISENDYGNNIQIKFSDESYLKLNGKYFRQYYDGSNEPWDPALYSLPPEFADWQDEDLYADRFTENLEYGRSLSDRSKIAFGYDLWGRWGREKLLRGEQSGKTGLLNKRSIPGRSYIDGLSHTMYTQYSFTTENDYNFSIRPSFEIYKDYQDIQFYRYSNGSLTQDRTFLDSPKFEDLRTELTLDHTFNNNATVYSGYMFDYLKNGSVRSEVRPVKLTRIFVEPNVDNERISSTGNLGTVMADFLGAKGLRLRASTRAETADTTSRGYGLAGSNSLYRFSRSDMKELWFSESLGLTYSGLKKANFDFGLDLDQRDLKYDEFFDAADHEIYTTTAWGNNPPQFMSYNTDMFYNDFKATARGSYRFNQHVKWNTQYRFKNQEHDYDTNLDSSLIYYPGVLGDVRDQVNEASTGLDVWWFDSWASGLKYQYVQDNFKSQASGENAQELTRNRVTANLMGQPLSKLTLVGSVTVERYLLNTPTSIPSGSTWLAGEDVYDYNGSYHIYNIDGRWDISDKRNFYWNLQQTSSMGEQDNVLYEATIGLTHKINEDSEFTAEYLFFDFNDENDIVSDFDSYNGHGILLSMTKSFF